MQGHKGRTGRLRPAETPPLKARWNRRTPAGLPPSKPKYATGTEARRRSAPPRFRHGTGGAACAAAGPDLNAAGIRILFLALPSFCFFDRSKKQADQSTVHPFLCSLDIYQSCRLLPSIGSFSPCHYKQKNKIQAISEIFNKNAS